MTERRPLLTGGMTALALAAILITTVPVSSAAQNFDFARLESSVNRYTVVLQMQIEFSFGMQTNEHEQHLLGTIVSEDGLVIFDGSILNEESPFEPMPSFSVKTTPVRITAVTMDEKEYEAEFVGVDRFTGLGFARIKDADEKFQPVRFTNKKAFSVGDWLALYTLLPEFVTPRLSADIAMVSALLETPEKFTLTVGFNAMEMGSVLFDESGKAVGVLGALIDPAAGQGGMMDVLGELDFPLLGVVTADKLEALIADPPQKGKIDRAWLGITLQALTPDIAEFLGIDVPGGIIVNEVVRESPADRAGLEVGDVVYAVNSQPVEIDREEKLSVFQRRISDMGAGSSVELSVLRPGEGVVDSLVLLTQLDAAPLAASDADEAESESLEFKVRELVFSDYVHFNVEPDELAGVLVTELKQGGLAYVGGLHLGDVIQRVGGSPISSIDDFRLAMDGIEAEKPREVILFVWRFNKTMFVNVKTDWE